MQDILIWIIHLVSLPIWQWLSVGSEAANLLIKNILKGLNFHESEISWQCNFLMKQIFCWPARKIKFSQVLLKSFNRENKIRQFEKKNNDQMKDLSSPLSKTDINYLLRAKTSNFKRGKMNCWYSRWADGKILIYLTSQLLKKNVKKCHLI